MRAYADADPYAPGPSRSTPRRSPSPSDRAYADPYDAVPRRSSPPRSPSPPKERDWLSGGLGFVDVSSGTAEVPVLRIFSSDQNFSDRAARYLASEPRDEAGISEVGITLGGLAPASCDEAAAQTNAEPGGAAPEEEQPSRARVRLRAAIRGVTSLDPFLTSRTLRADHWRPLKLRFDTEGYREQLRAPSPQRRSKHAHGKQANDSSATRPHEKPSALHWGSASSKDADHDIQHSHPSRPLDRSSVRLLKDSDTNVRIPPAVGKWLVQPANNAPDPRNRTRHQRILYTGKISLRFKDHILAQSPCAYALACPFPFMILRYVYDLWRVYTCAGCPAGVRAFDQPATWHSRQYDLRAYFHVYNNRVEVNYPTVRIPWGILGCGSWNSDEVQVHYFDRGSFGFRRVPCASQFHCCCAWEPFGEVVGRQRCPCNGPLVDGRGKVNCGQWWCDHWLCSTCCCHYHYPGLVDGEEAATACDVALQAFFDGEELSQDDFDAKLDEALRLRFRRKRRRKNEAKRFDADKHSYSQTIAFVALAVGVITIALQIFVVIAFALYVQYRWHRQWYVDYAQTLSNPEHYKEIFDNATKAADTLLSTKN